MAQRFKYKRTFGGQSTSMQDVLHKIWFVLCELVLVNYIVLQQLFSRVTDTAQRTTKLKWQSFTSFVE